MLRDDESRGICVCDVEMYTPPSRTGIQVRSSSAQPQIGSSQLNSRASGPRLIAGAEARGGAGVKMCGALCGGGVRVGRGCCFFAAPGACPRFAFSVEGARLRCLRQSRNSPAWLHQRFVRSRHWPAFFAAPGANQNLSAFAFSLASGLWLFVFPRADLKQKADTGPVYHVRSSECRRFRALRSFERKQSGIHQAFIDADFFVFPYSKQSWRSNLVRRYCSAPLGSLE